MRSTRAYETGRLIAELRWHLLQGCLRPRKGILSKAQQAASRLFTAARGLLRSASAQDALQAALRLTWEALDVDSFFEHEYAEVLAEVNGVIHWRIDPCLTRQCLAVRSKEFVFLLAPVLSFLADIQNQISAAIRDEGDTPDQIIRCLHFGVFVSGALYAPDVDQHMYRDWSDFSDAPLDSSPTGAAAPNAGEDADRHGLGSACAATPLTGLSSSAKKAVDEVPSYTGDRYLTAGSLPVADDWYQELQVRWQEFCLGALPARIEQQIAMENRDQPLERQHSPARILKLIGMIDAAFRAVAPRIEARLSSEPAEAQTTPSRRSTERGGCPTKIIAALTQHHKYAGESGLNTEPIGVNKLARQIGVSPGSVSSFFTKEFGGHTKYKSICRTPESLSKHLKRLNDDYAHDDLYGREPPAPRAHRKSSHHPDE